MSAMVNNNAAGIVGSTDHLAKTAAKVMVTADGLFTAVGDVQILSLHSECYSANGATASTLQYKLTPTTGTAATISGASASLANAVAGTVVVMDGSTLAAAPTVAATGVALNTTARGIIFKDGTLSIVVGVGSTTGTWKHYLRYEPLEDGAYVVPLQ